MFVGGVNPMVRITKTQCLLKKQAEGDLELFLKIKMDSSEHVDDTHGSHLKENANFGNGCKVFLVPHLVLNLHTLQMSMFQPDWMIQDFPRNVIRSHCSLPPICLKNETKQNKTRFFFFFLRSFKFTDRK